MTVQDQLALVANSMKLAGPLNLKWIFFERAGENILLHELANFDELLFDLTFDKKITGWCSGSQLKKLLAHRVLGKI